MWVGLRVGGGVHQDYGKRQVDTPVREGRGCSHRPQNFSFLETVLPIPSYLFQLKSVWELEKVKELNLEELWLEENPLCSQFSDQSDYIRYIMPATSFSPSLPLS